MTEREQVPDWRARGRALLPKDIATVRGVSPAIILIEPQLEENIGTCARAMGNCGLGDLRLVRPRPDHLAERAINASSGAEAILHQATVYDTVEEATADLVHLYATTARRRDMMKRIATPRKAAEEMHAAYALTMPEASGVLFGRERTGLHNDDVAIAEAIIEVPLNPSFCSLNLAQAVLLIGYEWYSGIDQTPNEQPAERASPPASQDDLQGFYKHLEHELIDCGFLRHEDKRPGMIRSIRSIFSRASLTVQEVRTLHGIVKELRWGRRKDRPVRDGNGSVVDWSRDGSQGDEDGNP